MRLSFQPQIQSDTTNLFETSPEILRLVSGVHCHVSETLSIFFHSILAWNQEICTSTMIFRHCMLFFGFFRTSVHTLVIKFPSKDASTFKFFRAYGISFDSRTSISNFHSLISKFRPTSNFKLTSTDYSPQTNKLTENSKPINKSIYVTRHYILKFKYRTKKNWKLKKKFTTLPSAGARALGKRSFAECHV